MANCIGFEVLRVGAIDTVSPALAQMQGQVRCAIFYVDPAGAGKVRWRADTTAPTRALGLPLSPGKTMVLAGEGNIRNSKFLLDTDTVSGVDVYAVYYDQVDVVDLGISGPADAVQADLLSGMAAVRRTMEEAVLVLQQIRFGVGKSADVDLARIWGGD